MDVTDDTSGSLLLRIWLNISENDSDRGSALLAYFEIYCKAAWILNTGFKSTLALHPCNWIRLCRLIYGSFQADTSSGWPYLSLRIYVCPLISFGYPNLHTVSLFFWLEGNRMDYTVYVFGAYWSILYNLVYHQRFRYYFFDRGVSLVSVRLSLGYSLSPMNWCIEWLPSSSFRLLSFDSS